MIRHEPSKCQHGNYACNLCDYYPGYSIVDEDSPADPRTTPVNTGEAIQS